MSHAAAGWKRVLNSAHNELLASFPPDCRAAFAPHLARVELGAGEVLLEPGKPISTVYFPLGAVLANSMVLEDGAQTLIRLIGREGFCGMRGLFDRCLAASRTAVVLPGSALTLPADRLRQRMEAHHDLRERIVEYLETLVAEGQQAVACSIRHRLDRRFALTLLGLFDRTDGDEIALTQEQCATLLGVRREGVSEAASQLREAGAISYARGRIRIRDRGLLEQAACECYRSLRGRRRPAHRG